MHHDQRSTRATKDYVFPTTSPWFGELESNRLPLRVFRLWLTVLFRVARTFANQGKLGTE
jgi:hypothetical protein